MRGSLSHPSMNPFNLVSWARMKSLSRVTCTKLELELQTQLSMVGTSRSSLFIWTCKLCYSKNVSDLLRLDFNVLPRILLKVSSQRLPQWPAKRQFYFDCWELTPSQCVVIFFYPKICPQNSWYSSSRGHAAWWNSCLWIMMLISIELE